MIEIPLDIPLFTKIVCKLQGAVNHIPLKINQFFDFFVFFSKIMRCKWSLIAPRSRIQNLIMPSKNSVRVTLASNWYIWENEKIKENLFCEIEGQSEN